MRPYAPGEKTHTLIPNVKIVATILKRQANSSSPITDPVELLLYLRGYAIVCEYVYKNNTYERRGGGGGGGTLIRTVYIKK